MRGHGLNGTLQNDILKEFIAQKEYIYPPRPSMRLVTDTFAFCAEHVPRWNSISVSGYHIREAGATAAQELAFTLRDGIEYVQAGIDAGLDVDSFAPRLSFFFNAQNDLLEEVAKFRAARRVWARVMRDRFGARDPKSWQLRCHAQTAGVSLTAQQPYNNVVRTTVQALAAVLGGVAVAPHQRARRGAGAAHRASGHAGPAHTADHRLRNRHHRGGGPPGRLLRRGAPDPTSWRREAEAYIARIDEMGGMIQAIEAGYPQREIAESAYRDQQAVEGGERLIVGVNESAGAGGPGVATLYIDDEAARHQLRRLGEVRARRDATALEGALRNLAATAQGDENTMPALLDAVRAYATLGEMCAVLRKTWGEYEEVPII